MPETKLPTVGARVMGLDDPETKMSKSAGGANHAVALLDPPDVIRRKIMRATTDSSPAVDFDRLGAGVENLLNIFQAFSDWPGDRMRDHFQGMRYGEMKKQVAEMVVASLEPVQSRYREIVGVPGRVARVLREGAERVSPVANSTIELVKRRMGLYT
jgi:tryptophanyl-tRNA synthetase